MPDFSLDTAGAGVTIGLLFSLVFAGLSLFERRNDNPRDAGLLASLGLAGGLGSLCLYLSL
ncbi:hypothetical protein RQP53_10745 [Paucibacter sp. APW11]|uniref:Uncharacterized protein n=1 Tax=Roseateles aquae TaxID=3077235 RepID=A0ABU3PAY8_9BURK|nr:hypothetical protein [Paucibacter sp. APW11]MDT8999745.1 hypothetical protein [Paucibacter sp. APW11]